MGNFTQEDIIEFMPRMEKLMHRAKRLSARAARRGDQKAAAGYTRACGHFADALADFSALKQLRTALIEEARGEEALRGDLRRRLEVFVAAGAANTAWEAKRAAYFEALRTGATAEDPGPMPYDEAAMDAIAAN